MKAVGVWVNCEVCGWKFMTWEQETECDVCCLVLIAPIFKKAGGTLGEGLEKELGEWEKKMKGKKEFAVGKKRMVLLVGELMERMERME